MRESAENADNVENVDKCGKCGRIWKMRMNMENAGMRKCGKMRNSGSAGKWRSGEAKINEYKRLQIKEIIFRGVFWSITSWSTTKNYAGFYTTEAEIPEKIISNKI